MRSKKAGQAQHLDYSPSEANPSRAKPTEGKPTEAKPTDPNEGEGTRTAARRYNEATRKYVESGRSEKAAEEAKAAVEGKRGKAATAELRRAEEAGKKPGIGDDDPR